MKLDKCIFCNSRGKTTDAALLGVFIILRGGAMLDHFVGHFCTKHMGIYATTMALAEREGLFDA